MSQELYLPEGSILTVTATEAVVARQIQDASITASIAAGTAQSFGPYPLGRDFIITGSAAAAIALAALGGDALSIVSITGDTTVSRLHASKVLQVNKGTNVTLTLPADAPAGMSFIVDQVGAGLALFVAASGASIVNRSSFDRTAGGGAMMNAYVRSNSNGASAVWVLGGDGATA